jgi:formylglycine-generating enzyme required for sulfatase activity
MSNKDFFFIAGLLAVFAACSSDDDMQSAAGQQELVPVTLSYQTQQADTRAAAGLTLNDDYIESGKEVTVQISDYNVNEYTKYTYTTGAAGALSLPPTNAPYYPLDNTHIDILAYFPGDAGIVFSIQSDQTTDANYVASDLMWATKLSNVGKTTSPRTLTFNHKMAKIRVNVTAGTQISQINSVTLKNVKPTVDFDQSDGTVTLKSDASATDVEMVKENTSASVSGAAVIPAQTLTGALLEIGVTKADATTGTATYAVDSKSFSENGVYTLNITVSWPEVGATTEVTDWDENGTVNIYPTGSPFKTFTVGVVSFKMVYVKGGNYSMTYGNYNPSDNTKPNNVTVTGSLSDYYIGQTEVTNGLWYAVMGSKPPVWSSSGANNGQPSQADNFPVAYVSWDQICTATTGFLDRLNAMAASQLPPGMTFQLPTEAQWQYAAMGGQYSNGYTYSGSNDIDNVAWYTSNSSTTTHQVATKGANELGLYDMTGNLWEWCEDYYAALPAGSLGADYVNTTTASHRVSRGGGWYYAAVHCPVSFRGYNTPSLQDYGLGFRLALRATPAP